jgi:hypothetical protein
MSRKAEQPQIQFDGERLNVFYPDARIKPRICTRTGILREQCVCLPCRHLRRRKHGASCTCWRCFADRMGEHIDQLGKKTAAGGWLWFVTLTFRTPHFPWMRGFPIEQPEPSPDFVHHFFARMVAWLEGEVHSRVEYFVADQFGEVGGRIHLHCGLSWPGLFEYRWKPLQQMLWDKAGFNRILRWEKDAAFYIGRYIGRDAARAHWDWNVGAREPIRTVSPVGRNVIVTSVVPDDSSSAYRQTAGTWHR